MTTGTGREPGLEAARRKLRRAALVTSGAGIGYGVLTIIAWLLMRNERLAIAEGADAFVYSEEGLSAARVAGFYLLPFAAILFVWFIVALRGWIRGTQHRRNMLISDLQLVSGAIFTAVFLVGAAAVATSVVVASVDHSEAASPSLRVLAGFGNSLMVVMGIRMAAIFVIATASLGMTTGVAPRWFNFLSYGFGLVLMLAPIVESAFTLAFPVWVIALSVMLLYHLANLGEEAVPGFARRYAESASGGDRSGDAFGD